MRRRFIQILLLTIATLILASCALFRPKCPIPNCKTRKYHQHALVFDMKTLRKEARKRKVEKIKKFFGIKKKAPDSTSMALTDSTSINPDPNVGGGEDEIDTSENGQEQDEIVVEEPPIEQPKKEKKKKKNKKSKEEKEEEALLQDEESFGDEGDLEEPKKKKFKWPWQKSDEEKYLEEEEQMESTDDNTDLDEVNGVDEEDFAKEWRSRRWKFWGNQRPKVGQRWKAPKDK